MLEINTMYKLVFRIPNRVILKLFLRKFIQDLLYKRFKIIFFVNVGAFAFTSFRSRDLMSCDSALV